MRKIWGVFVLICIHLTTVGQSFKRIELPLTTANESFKLIPLPEEGFLLASQPNASVLQLTRFDTTMAQVWQIETEIDRGFSYIDHYADASHLHILFGNRTGDQYVMVKSSHFLGAVQKVKLTGIRGFDLQQFRVVDESIFLAGSVKSEPILLSYAFQNMGKPRLLTSGYGKNASIQNLEAAEDNLLLTFSVKERKFATQVIREITPEGRVVRQLVINPKDGLSLLTGKVFQLASATFLVGSYGIGGTSTNSRTGPQTQGIYLANITGGRLQSMTYHPFGDFQNFFNYLPNRAKERVEKTVSRKKSRGGDYATSARVLIHDVLESEDDFTLVAEVFSPEYVTQYNTFGMSPFSPFWGYPYMFSPIYRSYWGFNSWAWNPWLMGSPANNQVFNGFRYTHGIVVTFNEKGQRLSDQTVVYENLKLNELKEKLKVTVRDDQKVAVYTRQNELVLTEFDPTTKQPKKRAFEIVTGKDKDRIRETTFEDTAHWYDRYFLAWGIQRIANSEERNRKVFYIHRIRY